MSLLHHALSDVRILVNLFHAIIGYIHEQLETLSYYLCFLLFTALGRTQQDAKPLARHWYKGASENVAPNKYATSLVQPNPANLELYAIGFVAVLFLVQSMFILAGLLGTDGKSDETGTSLPVYMRLSLL